MARKEKLVVIDDVDDKNRDKGKIFKIKEMPASQGEWWATRAIQGVIRAGVEVPDYVRGAGMAGVALLGLRAFAHLPQDELKGLMDEMFGCISIVRDKAHTDMAFALLEDDIEEVTTRLRLRDEVIQLHTGFSFADEKWISGSSAGTTNGSTSNTQTSPEQSVQ